MWCAHLETSSGKYLSAVPLFFFLVVIVDAAAAATAIVIVVTCIRWIIYDDISYPFHAVQATRMGTDMPVVACQPWIYVRTAYLYQFTALTTRNDGNRTFTHALAIKLRQIEKKNEWHEHLFRGMHSLFPRQSLTHTQTHDTYIIHMRAKWCGLLTQCVHRARQSKRRRRIKNN